MIRTVHDDIPEQDVIEQEIEELFADGLVYRKKVVREILASKFSLSGDQRDKRFRNKIDNVFYHYCSNAIEALYRKGKLERVARGCYRIKTGTI